jgi:hypothetical protein
MFLRSFFFSVVTTYQRGASGSVVCWGTMLQAGRSRVRFPMMSLDSFNLRNPASRTMALGTTQPLTEISTRNLPEGIKGGRRVRLSILPPSVSPLPIRCGSIDVSQPYGPSQPVIRIAFLQHTKATAHPLHSLLLSTSLISTELNTDWLTDWLTDLQLTPLLCAALN